MQLYITSLIDIVIIGCFIRDPQGLQQTQLDIKRCHHQNHHDYLQIVVPTRTQFHILSIFEDDNASLREVDEQTSIDKRSDR